MLKLRPRGARERRSDGFGLLRTLQLCIAVLLCTVVGMPQANAQTAVVTAGSPHTSAGSGTVTYSASVSTTDPVLNSEQQITSVVYAWVSGDTCNPVNSASTTVTAQRSSPGASSSSVGCSVVWYIYNKVTKVTTTASAGGGVTVNFTLGVLWSPGTITGGILTAPQNQTSSPYVPTAVVTSSGAQLTCTISNATATDTSTFNGSPSTTGTDTVTYAWTASAGTLGSATSASTSWAAPSTPQSSAVTLTCKISATAPAVTSPDGGTRGPSPKTATVSIYIPTLTVTGDSGWTPNPGFVGDPIQCSANGTVTPSIPGATNSVQWSTSATYLSTDGSDPMSAFGGSEAYVYTQGSLSSQFTATFFATGYYMIAVQATDTLKDSSGNTLGTLSGNGYVGGSAADLTGGSSASVASVTAQGVTAHASGSSSHIPVKPPLSIVALVSATNKNSGTPTAPHSVPSDPGTYDIAVGFTRNQYQGETGYQATPSTLAGYKWTDNNNNSTPPLVQAGVFDFQANIDRIYQYGDALPNVLGKSITLTCTGTKSSGATVTSNSITVNYHFTKEGWVHIGSKTPYYKATAATSCKPDANTQRLLTDTFTISFDKFPIDVDAMANSGVVIGAVGAAVSVVPEYGPLIAAGLGVISGGLTGASAAVSGAAVNSSPDGYTIWKSATSPKTYPEGCIFKTTPDFAQVADPNYYGYWRWSDPTDVQQYQETDWAGNAYDGTGYTGEVQKPLYPSTNWELGGATFWFVGK